MGRPFPGCPSENTVLKRTIERLTAERDAALARAEAAEAGLWGATARTPDGSRVEVNGGTYNGWYLAGEFLRAPVRPVTEALGCAVSFTWSADKSSCLVRLAEAGA